MKFLTSKRKDKSWASYRRNYFKIGISKPRGYYANLIMTDFKNDIYEAIWGTVIEPEYFISLGSDLCDS